MLNYMQPASSAEFRWREVDKKSCTNQFRNEMKRDLFQCVSKFKRDIPIQFSAFFRSHSLSLTEKIQSELTCWTRLFAMYVYRGVQQEQSETNVVRHV